MPFSAREVGNVSPYEHDGCCGISIVPNRAMVRWGRTALYSQPIGKLAVSLSTKDGLPRSAYPKGKKVACRGLPFAAGGAKYA